MKNGRFKTKSGFTLLEMLVVMGIIAILAGASMIGYSKVVKSAKKARTQELVANTATALTQILSKNNGVWPKELVAGMAGGKGRLDKDVSRVFARRGLLGLTYNQSTAEDKAGYELRGKDRCGIVDAETEDFLKRAKSASESSKVPTGGTVKDHILYYAIDDDDDGFTNAQVDGASGTLKIRAIAVVWAAGPDGKVDYSTYGRNDDVYSWRPSQVEK